MKALLSIFSVLLVFSCRTVQFKRDYINKQGEQIFNNYSNNRSVVSSGDASKLNTILKNDKFLDTVSFRYLKKSINIYESYFAMQADSISYKNKKPTDKLNMIDSFYFNSNKIKFIKKNKINSPNIHLKKK